MSSNIVIVIMSSYLSVFIRLILLPVRVLIFFTLLFITNIHICYCDKNDIPTVIKGYATILLNIFGIKIHTYSNIYNIDSLKKDQYIVLYNHINAFDTFILYNLFESKISPVVYDSMKNWFMIKHIYKRLDSIYVGKGINGKTTIQNRLDIGDSICIAPDGCKYIKQGQYIHPFFDGAFVSKNKNYLPIVIRYVPSVFSDINSRNTTSSMIMCFIKVLIDGHVDVFVSVLDSVKDSNYYDGNIENTKQNLQNIKQDIYDKMCKDLSKLPEQYPPRYYIKKKTSILCASSCMFLFGCLGVMSSYFNILMYTKLSIIIAFSGLNYHLNKNRLNLFVDQNVVKICVLLMMFYYNNTLLIQSIKTSIVSYVYNFYTKNYDNYTDIQHVFYVHIPMALCSFISLCDIVNNGLN